MFDIASGAAASVAVGLVGAVEDPPLTPEPVGPAPSNYEAPPVPIRSFETILAERTAAAAQATETRRLVVRLLGGEELELGSYDDRDTALEAARELMSRFSAAESSGEWPEVEGRFMRPGAVASIDVLVSA
jgi:hypothetical protein